MSTDWAAFHRRARAILSQSKEFRRLYSTGCVNEPVQLLRTMTRALPEPDRSRAPEVLWHYATPSNAGIVALVILPLHAISSSFGLSSALLGPIFEAATAYCVFEPTALSSQDLSDLRSLVQLAHRRLNDLPRGGDVSMPEITMSAAATVLAKALNEVEYARVRQEVLEGENPEINTDRVALVSKYRQLGLTGDLEAALESIDSEFAGAADQFEFRAVIDAVRSALEHVVENAARLDAAAVNASVKMGPTPARFNDGQKALVRTGLLAPTEGEALQAFYNMVSVEGSHSLGSEREQARLSKNMMIEWGRLILDRVRINP